MSHYNFKIEEKQNIYGFVTTNANKGEEVEVCTKAIYTSDNTEFYHYIDSVFNVLLSHLAINVDDINRVLVLIHKDLTVDAYINDFIASIEIKTKRDIKGGEMVYISDIADIKKVVFPEIIINPADKVIYCVKVGWKFGLYLNFNHLKSLDIKTIQSELGHLHRYLKFQYVYKSLENEKFFEELLKDGWFPFIELMGEPYKRINEIYTNKFNFNNNIDEYINKYDKQRIASISGKWWNNKIFSDKKALIETGLEAYYQNDKKGFISCIKNLTLEIEGIMRISCYEKMNVTKPSATSLIDYVINEGKQKCVNDEDSLFLPDYFLRYLKEVYFADFDLSDGTVVLSRNSTSHGVVKEEEFNKLKAFQAILILDQLFYYLN